MASCATLEQELSEAKNSWQGASYEEVVARWGAPARSTTLADGRQTHTWVSQEAPVVYGGGPQIGVGVGVGSGGRSGVGIGVGFPFGGTASRAASCERTFTFDKGTLVDQSWIGDPAYCRYFKRP